MGWCKWGGSHTFCVPENEGLHKILQLFLRGHVFFVHYIFLSTKENSTEGTNNKSNLLSACKELAALPLNHLPKKSHQLCRLQSWTE